MNGGRKIKKDRTVSIRTRMKLFPLLIIFCLFFGCAKKVQLSKSTSSSSGSDILDPKKQPLILLDFATIESKDDLNSVDPNSIESIEVIKDSEVATKMYGERAKDGVIIIRTKEYEQKKKQQLYNKLQQYLKGALGNEDDYFFVLDGIPINEGNVEKLFELEPQEITVVEEITAKAAAVIYDTTPRKYTILINTKKKD